MNDDSSDEDDGDVQRENSCLPVVRPFVHLPHCSVLSVNRHPREYFSYASIFTMHF
jgi:hypothetical protein